MECVEKHLGAAYVLLTETNDGYAHRLRGIGHLHEAEDESQEWSELHNAIREARKQYQTDGIMPDWAALELLLGHVDAACARNTPATLGRRVLGKPIHFPIPNPSALRHW